MRETRVRWAETLVGVGWLGAVPVMREGDLSGDFLLKVKVGSFFVPESEGGGYCIHGLDVVHDPSGDSCGKVGD